MRSGKWYLLHIILLSAVLGGFFGSSCKKYDPPFNNNVIRTPYPLYFADKLGALYNTNDGKAYKIVFPADGVSARAVATSGDNLMFIKFNALINPNGTLFLSSNNGVNFNPLNTTVSAAPLWQNQILDVPSWTKLYLSSATGNGVQVSTNHGLTWGKDGSFDPLTATVHSFSQLSNGKLYGLDYNGPRLFEKTASTSAWSEITGAATPLPGGRFQLSHFNNTLVAADYDGPNGISYTSDGGVNWTPYAGVPNNHKIFVAASPHDRVLLAGFDSIGVYRLVGNSFMPSNNGLEPNTSVYSIVGKQDIYKNEIIKQYIYIATSKGLFRSEDLGQNWILTRAGDYRNVY